MQDHQQKGFCALESLIQISCLQKPEVHLNLLSEIPRQFSTWFPREGGGCTQTPACLFFPKSAHWSPIYIPENILTLKNISGASKKILKHCD